MKMKEKIEELLKNLSFWNRLQESERELVVQNSKIMEYQAGDAVYSGGTQCLGMMMVLEGTLRTYLLSDEGKEVTIYRLRQGDVCVLAASCLPLPLMWKWKLRQIPAFFWYPPGFYPNFRTKMCMWKTSFTKKLPNAFPTW